MASASSHVLGGNWKDSYRAVLSERDRQQLPNRIAQAERDIIFRGREILKSSNSLIELEALDTALDGLRALRVALLTIRDEPGISTRGLDS
jgi:hypothetical protein